MIKAAKTWDLLRFLLLFTVLLEPIKSSAATVCPTPPTQVNPSVVATVTQNGGVYTYSYKLISGSDSSLKIGDFVLLIDEMPSEITSPHKWRADFTDLSHAPKHLGWWSVLRHELNPGESVSGFGFKSTRPPGVIKFFSEGHTKPPTVEPTEDNDEPTPDCPGFFYGGASTFNDMVVGMTIGPADPNQISAEMEINHKGSTSKKPPRIGPENNEIIKVLLIGNEKLDVDKINMASLEFGPGRAKPISSKIINGNGEGQDKDLKGEQHKKNLLMEFELKSVEVRCSLDRALFLRGKVGDKIFLSGAPIEPVYCTKDHPKFDRTKSKPYAPRVDILK